MLRDVKTKINLFIKSEEQELSLSEHNFNHLKERGGDLSRIEMWKTLASSSKKHLQNYAELKEMIDEKKINLLIKREEQEHRKAANNFNHLKKTDGERSTISMWEAFMRISKMHLQNYAELKEMIVNDSKSKIDY